MSFDIYIINGDIIIIGDIINGVIIIKLISCHWSLLIPPENIRKSEVFRCFQGVSEETRSMKWVNEAISFSFSPLHLLVSKFTQITYVVISREIELGLAY